MPDPYEQWTEEALHTYLRAAFKAINDEYAAVLRRSFESAAAARLADAKAEAKAAITKHLGPDPEGEQP